MPWDNTKDTAADPDNPNADEQLTATEWNTHVDEGHWPSDELQVGVNNGDPVLTDPQNNDQVVLRYDRSAGSWVVDALEAAEVINGPIYAGNFSGADAEARLDNAIASADTGDEIVLETEDYTADRTINFQGSIRGPSWGTVGGGTSAEISGGTWTLTGNNIYLSNISSTGDIVVSSSRARLNRIYEVGNGITIQADEAGVYQCRQPAITFESGTSDGIAAGNTRATITDNGSNIIGDNS